MRKKIKNQWCIYGGMFISGFGKIVEESFNCVWIRYYEDQLYGNQCWDPNYVKRFETLEEAAKKYQEYCGYYLPDWKLKEKMIDAFPSYFKQKSKKSLKKEK